MLYLTPILTARGSPFLSATNTGLGNVLFQIASVYGIAHQTGRTPSYATVRAFAETLASRFGYTHGRTLFRACLEFQGTGCEDPTVHEATHKCVSPALLDSIRASTTSLLIDGYLESPLYFASVREDILRMFAPDRDRIRALYPELFDPSRVFVSVHIRQGSDRNTGCAPAYYTRALAYIRERAPTAEVLIVSDGPDTLGLPGRRIAGHEDYIDLWICSLCAHNITTYSTFSWWGAYLNTNPTKLVTYPASAARFISRWNGVPVETLHTDYFLSAVCIEDEKE
jgi:hypothetical protein